ncbi:MAG: hypothetical protein ACFFDT_36590, partial [Candidatus Hodarchaeota archaeon]
ALLRVIREIIALPFEVTTYFALFAAWKIFKEKREQMCLLIGWCVASISVGLAHGVFLWIQNRQIVYLELIQPYRLEQLLYIPTNILASMGLILVYDYVRQPEFRIHLDSERFPFINRLMHMKKQNIIRFLAIIFVINAGINVAGMTVLLHRPTIDNTLHEEAFDWIMENTPEDAYILNDDSGFWIPSITGRKIAFPNIAASDRPLVSQSIWDLYSQLRTLNASEGEIAGEKEYEMMVREGLDYIFITPTAEYSAEYWVNIPADIFSNNTLFWPAWNNNSTQIYTILYNIAI